MLELPTFLLYFAGAAAAAITRGRLRALVLLLVPVAGVCQLLVLPHGVHWQATLLEYELSPFRVDRISVLFGYAFHLVAFLSILYALHVRDTVQQVAGVLYAGSALGAVFAGDLLTLFVFWELMAFSSVFLVWASRTRRAYFSGMRYLVIQVLSGILLLIGILFYAQENDTLAFGYVGLDGAAGWLIFIAFGIKCAFPFLHTWVTDAYPEATFAGTVFLSAFTTKVAVYALARGYPGTELLVYIGAAMACFPIFYAVIENDLRRVLAYSLINQVGFMVVGIGIGTALAINGAVAHAFTDIFFKGLLFMSMGAVLYMTGRINGSDLGGLYKSMPVTATLCIIGAASISAFPLFSGFISKSMVMSAAIEQGHDWIWLALLFASAGVFHHAGIKIPYFAFFAHDSGIRTTEPPINMLAAMGLAALLCVVVGSFPSLLYDHLPFELAYTPYDATHVLAQVQLLLFSALAFAWLQLSGIYPPELHSVNLDVDWIHRRLLPRRLHAAAGNIKAAFMGTRRALRDLPLKRLVAVLMHKLDYLPARPSQTSTLLLWAAILLSGYIIYGYIVNAVNGGTV